MATPTKGHPSYHVRCLYGHSHQRSDPQSSTLEVNMLTITPLIQLTLFMCNCRLLCILQIRPNTRTRIWSTLRIIFIFTLKLSLFVHQAEESCFSMTEYKLYINNQSFYMTVNNLCSHYIFLLSSAVSKITMRKVND
jgi:hypothetical protein